MEKKDINPFVITPTRHYSNTPKLIEIESYLAKENMNFTSPGKTLSFK